MIKGLMCNIFHVLNLQMKCEQPNVFELQAM